MDARCPECDSAAHELFTELSDNGFVSFYQTMHECDTCGNQFATLTDDTEDGYEPVE